MRASKKHADVQSNLFEVKGAALGHGGQRPVGCMRGGFII
jgi:hypothetical protein